MTGRQFEDFCVKELHKSGYWVHRIHPDESGQQPFDIIAIRGDRICVYDAKVVSEGHRFPLSRIEDNQWNAFRLIERKTSASHIGLLIWEEGKIRYMSLAVMNTAVELKKKGIEVNELPEWRP